MGVIALFATAVALAGSPALERLPAGAVKPEGWLKRQLELQRDGLTGNAESLYADIGQSDWLTGGSRGGEFAWERGPYYVKGLLPLAFQLDDPALKAKAKRWVDALLTSQRENGDFGPRVHNWWANMLALHILRDWQEATGDTRVFPFLEKYFRHQLTELPKHPLSKDSVWAVARGGDNLEVVLWLYSKTGGDWLVDLARIIEKQTGDWEAYYTTATVHRGYPEHIVNIHQGLKEPALAWWLDGATSRREAHKSFFSPAGWVRQKCGRADGMLNGTEPLTDKSSTQGTELCAVAECILSCGTLQWILADTQVSDIAESIAYNVLPAELSEDIRGQRYYTLPNQPECRDLPLGFRHNGENCHSICPGPESGFGCCRSNLHMAWPKFIQHLWFGLPDGGLCAAAYGPCRVANVLPDGKKISFRVSGSYPFGDDVEIAYDGEEATFPLRCRVPGWSVAPVQEIDGTVRKLAPGSFAETLRTWKKGDTLKLRFPAKTVLERNINNAIAVKHGALLYAYPVPNERVEIGRIKDFITWELHATASWNFALKLPRDARTIAAEPLPTGAKTLQPFSMEGAPLKLRVEAFRAEEYGWGKMRTDLPSRANEPPQSPLKRNARATEVIELVPYGCAQTRISLFPWGD